MTKSGNKKRKKLSSSSSAEAGYSAEGKGDEAFESERSAAMATNGVNETLQNTGPHRASTCKLVRSFCRTRHTTMGAFVIQ